jgi:uncharacterized RDD family membrane protein YckC
VRGPDALPVSEIGAPPSLDRTTASWGRQASAATSSASSDWSAGSAPAGGRAEAPPELASVGRRIGAFAIDLVITVISFFVVAVIVLLVNESSSGVDWDLLTEDEQDVVMGWAFVIWSLLFFLGTWVLNATGASLGKRIVGLRIVRDDLSAPGLGAGFGRTIGAWLSWPVIGLGYLWATWDDRRQTWHDKMASTYVVRAELVARARFPDPPGIDRR